MIPREMLQEILMKLPIKDVARCCCVSRSWRGAVRDPSFCKLHAEANYAAPSSEAEALLLYEIQEAVRSGKTGVLSLSSGKAMCSFTTPLGYGLANICNGLLCFVQHDDAQAPAVVCNPATGETAALPKAPPLSNGHNGHLFALGFSPPTSEYKLFRLSFRSSYSSSSEEEERVELDVYTLGDTLGWRKSESFLSPSRPITRAHTHSTPVLIGGRIHVLTIGWQLQFSSVQDAKGVLVVDVAGERCRTYPLPANLPYYDNPQAFELNGRLCFATHTFNRGRPMALRFWVMSPPPEKKESDDRKEPQYWDLLYSFYVEGPCFYIGIGKPWSAWCDKKTLCYMRDGTLCKYETRPSIPDGDQLIRWDEQLGFQRSALLYQYQCNIHGGYRPTLLSPRIFELPPSQDDTTT